MFSNPTFEEIEEALFCIPANCTRDDWVAIALALKSELGESGSDLYHRWSSAYEGYSVKEASAVWKSARSRSITINTMFGMAKGFGYRPDHSKCTAEEKSKRQQEWLERTEQLEAERAKQAKHDAKWQQVVATAANELVDMLVEEGTSPYLDNKKVMGFNLLFPPYPILIRFFEDEYRYSITALRDEISQFWENRNEEDSFRYLKRGQIILPMFNASGQLVNLQIIYQAGGKSFLPSPTKQGSYFELSPCKDGLPIFIGEGFATVSTVHMATKQSCVAAFDAGNLPAVAKTIRDKFPNSRIYIVGDDDIGAKGNPGRTKANQAAILSGGLAIFPKFREPATKENYKEKSDFNDMHVLEGLESVRNHIRDSINPPNPPRKDGDKKTSAPNLKYAPPLTPPESASPDLDACFKRFVYVFPDGKIWDSHKQAYLKVSVLKQWVGKSVYEKWMEGTNSEGRTKRTMDAEDLRPLVVAKDKVGIGGLAQALQQYVYLNPSSEVWDKHKRKIVRITDLKYAIADCFDQWIKHPERPEIPCDNLVFDPTQSVGEGHINRFRGLPLSPIDDDSKCSNILRMLKALCDNRTEVYEWLLKWLAYPLQNVGAKMVSAILMHSDVHGAGKSFFFDRILRNIYGEYSSVFGQSELESQYNDWMSECLFGVFEEVLSRSQKYSHTGTVKQMISGDRVRLNKKFMSGWEESNHMNCVFLSNEAQPLPVEPSDRRFLVVWPKQKLDPVIKDGVVRELNQDGAAALLGYLLRMDLGDFHANTEPPMTVEKQRLIDFGRQNWEVFLEEWKNDELDYPFWPVLVNDVFDLYVRWCNKSKEHALGRNKFSQLLATRLRKRRNVDYKCKNKRGKGTFFFPEDAKCPEDKHQEEWLGGYVDEFVRRTNTVVEVA